MKKKKELESLVEKRNNDRIEKIQKELEMYKEDIDSYIENKLIESINCHYSRCTIYFEGICKIIKKVSKENINITEEDIYIFLKNRESEFKENGYIITWDNEEAMFIYFDRIDFILGNPLCVVSILILVISVCIIIFLLCYA